MTNPTLDPRVLGEAAVDPENEANPVPNAPSPVLESPLLPKYQWKRTVEKFWYDDNKTLNQICAFVICVLSVSFPVLLHFGPSTRPLGGQTSADEPRSKTILQRATIAVNSSQSFQDFYQLRIFISFTMATLPLRIQL
jgi:hypothetical protein